MLRTALTIGNFDGVHRGHVALARAARAACGDDSRVVALVFDPHPASVLRPDAAPEPLSTFSDRAGWLRQAGVDDVHRLEPTEALLRLDAGVFLDRILAEHRPDAIVEGRDFRFGRDREGSVRTLQAAAASAVFEVVVVPPVEAALANQQLVRVSSTLVRSLVARGRVDDARRLLGRPYRVAAEVVSGDRRGRTIGVPTANLGAAGVLLPGDGIYAGVAARPDGTRYRAAISVGTKPTFGGAPRTCEVHLIGYEGPVDDYGWDIEVWFERWLRGQIRYAGAQPLVEQLERDIAAAAHAQEQPIPVS